MDPKGRKMPPGKQPGFINRNLVAIVMIPSIFLIHVGWKKLQDNKALVPDDNNKEYPIIGLARILVSKLTGGGGTSIPEEISHKKTSS